jgi:hypothetical protein
MSRYVFEDAPAPSGVRFTYVKEPTYSPTEGMSNTELFLAGAGKALTDLGRGVGQVVGLVSRKDVAESRRLDKPLMNTGAGLTGNIVGNVAATLPTMAIPGVNTLRGAAIVGGGLGLAQPSVSTGETVGNTLLGTAGGAAGQQIAQKVAMGLAGTRNTQQYQNAMVSRATGQPSVRATGGGYTFGSVGDDASAGLTRSQANLAKEGEKLGFKLTPGQASGSRSLQQLEAKLESQPMTSGTFNAIKDQNQKTLNRIAANAIGESSDSLDSTVLANATDRIGNVYKMVADKTPKRIDPDSFLQRMAGIEQEFEGLANISQNPLVNKLFSFATKGETTREQLQDVASKLGKAATAQMTSANGDRQLGMALFQVKDFADDLLQEGLKGETQKAFREARQQYRNLMLLTQRQGVVNPSTGNVQGNALASVLQQKDRQGFLLGRNDSDLYKAARFAQAFRPIVGDSGTATRSTLVSPMDILLTAPFNVATRAYTSAPVTNVARGAGAGVGVTPQGIDFLSRLGATSGAGLLGAVQE